MGDYRTVTAMETFLALRNERHPTEIADLCRRPAVTAVETDEGRQLGRREDQGPDRRRQVKARFMRQTSSSSLLSSSLRSWQ